MKKVLKIFLLLTLIVACFVMGYQLTTQSDEVVYNITTERFIHENPEIIISRIENKDEGIYYFGFSTCPWCVELLPLLDETLEQNEKQAFVVNTRGEEFTDELRERTETIFRTYQEGDLTVPFLIIISDKGEVKTHIGTVEGHDAQSVKLSEQQEEELRNLLNSLVSGDCGCSTG